MSRYGSLAEFELLRDCRDDIRVLPWADSANRQASIYQLKIERAEEERLRLNLEIQRLVTFMKDEELQINQHIAALKADSPLLAAELQSMLARRVRVNGIHHARISRIYTLQAYNGSRDPSVCIDQDITADVVTEGMEECIFAPDEDNAIGDQLDGLMMYLENLSLDL